MITENTSPIVGIGNIDLHINPNKLYSIYEYQFTGDDFSGGLNITTDRFVQFYIFSVDDSSGIFSNSELIASTTTDNSNKISLVFTQKMDSKIRIVCEYDEFNANGESDDLVITIDMKNYQLGEFYKSDFYMYETKSGIPYPMHLIGSYSLSETNIPTTRTGEYYKKIGTIYENVITGAVTLDSLKQNVTYLITILSYEHFRSILVSNLNLTLSAANMNTNLINNVQKIKERILLGRVITNLEILMKQSEKYPTFLNLVKATYNINTSDPNFYNVLVDNIDNLVDEAIITGMPRKIVDLCEEAQDILSDPLDMTLSTPINLHTKLTTFIPYLTNVSVTEADLGVKAHEINIMSTAFNFNILNTDEKHYKYVIKLTKTSTPSGILDIQGDSKFTEKYASSKILVGHFHENERGYLKRTLVTSKFGKSHKDAFVKNRSEYGKEEDYIYLDLLESTKNIFSNSNKYLRGVALLTKKQFPDPPKANIVIYFKNIDDPDIPIPGYELPLIIEDVHMYDVYAEHMITVDEGLPTERRFVLLNKNDFARIIVRQKGVNAEFTFNYTERSGNYTAKYVKEDGVEIKSSDVIQQKIGHQFPIIDLLKQGMAGVTSAIDDIDKTYKLDHYVITTPSKTETIIRANKPSDTVVKFDATGTNDEFEVVFHYKLITKTFKFNFIDKDTLQPIDMTNDPLILPPRNVNPLIFADKHKIEFRPESEVSVDNDTKYTCVPEDFKWYKDLATDNNIDPVVYNIKYDLVLSKLIFKYVLRNNHGFEIQPDVIIGDPVRVRVGTGYADIYLEKDDIHYEIVPKTGEEFDETLNQYTKILQAKKDTPEITYYFEYAQLIADTVQIVYEDEDGEDIGSLFSGTAAPQTFTNTGNISTSSITVPSLYMVGTNIEFHLKSTVSDIIILPSDKQADGKYRKVIKYIFEKRYLTVTPTIDFAVSTVCDYRLGTHFFLLDQNNKVRATFDLNIKQFAPTPTTYTATYNGLTINLQRRIFVDASGAALTQEQIDLITPTSEQAGGRPSLAYRIVIEGTIERNLSSLLGTDAYGDPITYKLVGTNHISDTHSECLIYTMTYSDYNTNGPLTSTYGHAVGRNKDTIVNDFNQNYTLTSLVMAGPGAPEFTGGKTLLTINMNAESEETIFRFATDTIYPIELRPSTFTLSVGSLSSSL